MEIENRETFEITMMTLVNCMSEILPLLQDDSIFEVYINPDGKVWTDSFRGRECTKILLVVQKVFFWTFSRTKSIMIKILKIC